MPSKPEASAAMPHERRESIDLGLAVLSVINAQGGGEPLTCEAIAEICGCSRGTINAIERRALAKIAPKLRAYVRQYEIPFP
jgi:DNA-binding CsgD family transcriptional regulator